MNQKKHKTEDLGNWKPFVEQLHKEWEKVKSEQVDENLELKEKTWKRVDRKIFSPRRYILRAGWAVAAALVGVMLYWGYKIPEKHEIKSVAYIEHQIPTHCHAIPAILRLGSMADFIRWLHGRYVTF